MPRPDYRTLGLSVPVTDLLDPQAWRERYAWGVALGGTATTETLNSRLRKATAEGGSSAAREVRRLIDTMPDDVIRWHLRAAVSELELKLGMPLGMEVCKAPPLADGLRQGTHYDRQVGRLPYLGGNARNFYRIDLPAGIISVERIRGVYLGNVVWEVSTANGNQDNIVVEWGRQGIIHILPVALNATLVTQGGEYGAFWMLSRKVSPLPDFWAVDYTRGPVSRHGGQPGEIEAVLANWVYCAAGLLLLSIGGLASTKGLQSSSISLDGVSRSINFASGGLNSALEKAFDDAMKRIDWKRLRSAKRGLRVIPLGY